MKCLRLRWSRHSHLSFVSAVILVLGCKDGIAPAREAESASLRIELSDGVDGTPAIGTATYAKGSRVDYNFSPRSTHTDLVVTIDGRLVPPSGSVVMDTSRLLVASATPRPLVRQEDAPLVASAAEIVTSADPVVAFNMHLSAIQRLYREATPSDAA